MRNWLELHIKKTGGHLSSTKWIHQPKSVAPSPLTWLRHNVAWFNCSKERRRRNPSSTDPFLKGILSSSSVTNRIPQLSQLHNWDELNTSWVGCASRPILLIRSTLVSRVAISSKSFLSWNDGATIFRFVNFSSIQIRSQILQTPPSIKSITNYKYKV